MIPYGKHHIDGNDIKAVTKILKSNNLTQGPTILNFERAISKFVGSKYAVVVSSCTVLHIASMVAKNFKGKNLLTSPISFVSTANSSIFTGGNTIFCDVDPLTANLSINEIKTYIKKLK